MPGPTVHRFKNTCIATAASVQSQLITMRTLLWIDAGAILLLVVVRLYIAGPTVMDREEAFHIKLYNSLIYLDRAKQDWAAKQHGAEGELPTMPELRPYLGNWKDVIDQLTALGVRYTITPIDEDHGQTDTATLTKDIRFRVGFCRYYPAGAKFSLLGERAFPSGSPFHVFFQQNWAIILRLWVLVFVVGNAISLVRWLCGRARRTNESRREGGVEPPQPGL
jgi:hypothetical protein